MLFLLSPWHQVLKRFTQKKTKNTQASWSGKQCTVTTFLNQIFEESEQFSSNPMKVGGKANIFDFADFLMNYVLLFTKTTYANIIVISSAALTHGRLKRYVRRTQETLL